MSFGVQLSSPVVPFALFLLWVPLESSRPKKRVPLLQYGYWATKMKKLMKLGVESTLVSQDMFNPKPQASLPKH